MGIFKGGALRLLQTALYFINFCCAAIILGMSSTARMLANHERHMY